MHLETTYISGQSSNLQGCINAYRNIKWLDIGGVPGEMSELKLRVKVSELIMLQVFRSQEFVFFVPILLQKGTEQKTFTVQLDNMTECTEMCSL